MFTPRFCVPWTLATVLVTVLAIASQALADIPPGPGPKRPMPEPKPPVQASTVPLRIKTDEKATDARLVIPKKFQAGVEKKADATTPTKTIIAGLCLSLAAASVLFMRRGTRAGRIAAAAIIGITCAVGAWNFVLANAGPPPRAPDIEVTPFKVPVPYTGKVTIEYVDAGDAVELYLPSADPNR